MGANLLEFTAERDPDEPETPPAPEAENASVAAVTTTNITDSIERLASTATGGLRIASELAWGTLRSPVETWSEAPNTVQSVAQATKVPNGELNPMMSARSATYTFRTFDIPFRKLRTAAKKHDFTVNDVLLASCATGLAKHHTRYGKAAAKLRFVIPVSVRDPSQDGSTANEVALVGFPLPVSGASVTERLQAAHDEMGRWREEPALALKNPSLDASWLVPFPVLVRSARDTDVTTSNVPGPPFPCYISGARIVGTWPLVATGGGAANITMVTYDGTAFVGISTDDKAILDPETFLSDLRAGFAEVVGAPVSPASPIADSELRHASPAKQHASVGKPRAKSKKKPPVGAKAAKPREAKAKNTAETSGAGKAAAETT
jgi:diacylglycerol O-acyltransferase